MSLNELCIAPTYVINYFSLSLAEIIRFGDFFDDLANGYAIKDQEGEWNDDVYND